MNENVEYLSNADSSRHVNYICLSSIKHKQTTLKFYHGMFHIFPNTCLTCDFTNNCTPSRKLLR